MRCLARLPDVTWLSPFVAQPSAGPVRRVLLGMRLTRVYPGPGAGPNGFHLLTPNPVIQSAAWYERMFGALFIIRSTRRQTTYRYQSAA